MQVKKIFLISVLWLSVGLLLAQETVRTDSLDMRIFFRQGDGFVRPELRDNRITLENLKSVLDEAENLGLLREVSIRAYASPEGTLFGNERLARQRTDSLASWIIRNTNVPVDKLLRSYGGVGWNILREQLIEANLSYSKRVIDIIDNTPVQVFNANRQLIGSRKQALQRLEGGTIWADMYRRFYPDIRCCIAVVVKTVKLPEPVVVPEPVVEPEPVDTVVVPEPVPVVVVPVDTVPVFTGWMPRLHVKTNVLGLGLAIANAAVEVDICKHLSVSVPVYYSAWDYFSNTTKFRTFTVQPEVRYWFSGKANDGWFVGAHFGLSYYNFAIDGIYRTQDHDGETPAIGGGLAFGYRLPLGKNSPWRMEFSLGGGVYQQHHDKFRNYPNGLLVYSERKTYYGIDQASVSFAYSFNLKKKGGKR